MPDVYLAIPAAPVVIPAFLIVLALASAALQQRRQLTPTRFLTVLAAAAYGAALVTVTLFPYQVALGGYGNHVAWYQKVNLIPLVTADPVGFGLNILMMVPLGLLVPLILRIRSIRSAALVGFGVSATIELIQGVSDIVLSSGRTADVNDLIANTAGAMIGYVCFRRLQAARDGRLVERLSLEPTVR